MELSSNGQQVIVIVLLEGFRMEALINSRVHINIIDNILVQIQEIPTQKKKELYNLYIANREKHKDREVKIETKPLTMQIEHHEEKIKLDVIRMKHHLIILGMEQLERNNLIIDWRIKEIKQENKVWRPKLKREDVTIGQEATLEQEMCELREDNGEVDLSHIPKEYESYLDLFREMEKDNTALLPH